MNKLKFISDGTIVKVKDEVIKLSYRFESSKYCLGDDKGTHFIKLSELRSKKKMLLYKRQTGPNQCCLVEMEIE